MAAKRKQHKDSRPAKPKVRSPVPPPGHVIGPASYDRTAEKKIERQEGDEYLVERRKIRRKKKAE